MKKRLEYIFLFIMVVSVSILVYNLYKSYSFKHNPLPQSYIEKIKRQEQIVLENMQKNFGFRHKFPLIITDKIPGRLYGLTSYENGRIKIYLNKNVMQESMDYMVESVIPHEYAHALLFFLGKDTNEKGGHTAEWKRTCEKLGGKDCRQYVNQREIIMSKMPFK